MYSICTTGNCHLVVQGAPKPMSDCPGQVEIQFGQVNLWHNLSVGQAHFLLEKILTETDESWLQITGGLKLSYSHKSKPHACQNKV